MFHKYRNLFIVLQNNWKRFDLIQMQELNLNIF